LKKSLDNDEAIQAIRQRSLKTLFYLLDLGAFLCNQRFCPKRRNSLDIDEERLSRALPERLSITFSIISVGIRRGVLQSALDLFD
jgi:hypothetical protein